MIYLERFTANTPWGIFGRLSAGDMMLWTVEQPWRQNLARASCVPVGEYDLVQHESARYGNVWALVNRHLGVSHFPEAGVPRSAILIHPANRASELMGCIAPGMELGMLDGEWAVLNSRIAIEHLTQEISASDRITITHAAVDYSRQV